MPTGNLETFKLVNEGNFVISLRSFQGGIEYSKYRGIVSPAYNILEDKTDQNKMYYRYLFKCHDFIGELQRNVTGIRQGKNIDVNDFMEVILPIPSSEEQDQIVKFLDFQLAKINKFIKTKKKLISALKDYKQAIINEAVTKGITPNIKKKPSGVDWLGDIPEHWEIRRGKFFFREIDIRSQSEGDELLTVSHITGITPRSQKNVTMFKSESTVGYKKCFPNHIAVNTMWAWMGAIGVSNYQGVISPSYHTYEKIKEDYYSNIYLDNLLRSSEYVSQYRKLSTGIRSSRLRLYPDKFLTLAYIRPPIEEQHEIERYIESETRLINDVIYRNEKEIELITEFRTSLISDVVTGKVDVSHIELQNITEELEHYEDEEEEIDIEDADLEECEV